MGRSASTSGQGEGHRLRPRLRAARLIAYFDTSAFLKLVVDEPGSLEALALWEEADRRMSSRLLYPEARAALAAAGRDRRLKQGALGEAQSELERLWHAVEDIELTTDLALRAGDLAQELALRGTDAVHLATAEAVIDEDGVVASSDVRLANGARALGLAVTG